MISHISLNIGTLLCDGSVSKAIVKHSSSPFSSLLDSGVDQVVHSEQSPISWHEVNKGKILQTISNIFLLPAPFVVSESSSLWSPCSCLPAQSIYLELLVTAMSRTSNSSIEWWRVRVSYVVHYVRLLEDSTTQQSTCSFSICEDSYSKVSNNLYSSPLTRMAWS